MNMRTQPTLMLSKTDKNKQLTKDYSSLLRKAIYAACFFTLGHIVDKKY